MAFIPNSGSVAAWLQSDNASVITISQGSIAAAVTFPTTQNVSGSVLAFQGTNPWVITGSVQASISPAANQSVSGTVGASIIGTVPVTGFPTTQNVGGSVVAFIQNTPAVSVQGTVFISGSVITVGGTGTANQSVSGTVGASILGNVNTTITSVATVGGFLNVNLVGGSILTSSTPNQSISGTVQTQVQGSVATVIIGGSISASFTPPANQSVSGAVSVSNFPLTQNVSGSVVATQGTNPWTVVSSIAGGIFPISGSVAATITGTPAVSVQGTVFVSGSVITVGTAAPNQSVSGTVGASIIGSVPVTGFPTTQNISGSVVAFQGTTPWTISSIYGNVSGSIAGTYVNSAVASTVTGVAMMFKQNISTSIMTEVSPTFPLPITVTGVVPSQSVSGTVGASIIGQLPAGTAMIGSVVAYQGAIPWIIGSVYGNISGSVVATITGNPSVSGTVLVNNGSVVAFQGTSPWVVNFQNSSIIAVQAGSVISINQGSVATVQIGQAGTVITSIAGTYATGAASVVSGLGVQTLGLRNDSLASVFGANATYSPHTIGQWGETIIGIAPQAQWNNSNASLFTGVMQPIITSVSGSYVNVTGVQIANASANNVYITFSQNGVGSVITGSVVGYTVAPANGGSNITFPIPLRMSTVSRPFMGSVSGVASVFVSAQGFYSTT